MLNTWNQSLITQQINGTALASSAVATSLLPAAAKYTLPNNFLDRIGAKLRVRASGRISTLVTTPGTLTLDLRFGATVVWNGGAMALNTTAKVDVSWLLEVDLTVRAIGSAAALYGLGKWTSEAVIGSPVPGTGGSGVLLLPASSPTTGNTFDSTATQAVDFFGTWSVANAANSLRCDDYELLSCN